MRLAVIPARGGSKRIPRKNIKPFAGRPMIGWVIAAARESGLFDHVLVSTDDDEIAEIAQAHGAEVPFKRPAALSDDHAPTRAVITHAIGWYEAQGAPVAALCCLYATAAFVRPQDLSEAWARLEAAQGADFVFAAAEYPHPVHRAMRLEGGGGVEMLFPDHRTTRTQDLPHCVHDAGMFYWGHRDPFMAGAPMFSPRARAHVLPRERAVDIDTPEDWAFAEALFAQLDRGSAAAGSP
ncbi:MAG: pseudaminic acid cytidylyltransferase [Shimia sp.]